MCQVDERYNEPLARPALPSVCKKCTKCKGAPAAVVVRAGDSYCRTCFREYFIHKFRAMLGKNRVIFPGEKVLLAVSGGPSSSSMLCQVQEGLSQKAHKKLRFSPGIVYIDEGGAVGQSLQERRGTVSELQALFRATGFPFHVVPLEQVLDLPSSVLVAAAASSEPTGSAYKSAVDRFMQNAGSECERATRQDEAGPEVPEAHTLSLQQLLDSATTLTAREELLSSLRQHLLVHTARSQGYSKLMLGDSCSRLAVKLLTAICLGRGAQLAQDTGFSDSRYGDVVSVRPMRDYSAKEIAFYNHMFGVPSVFTRGLTTKTFDKSSIQHLTESFITKLQADFPSTVSTIYRTSEKLQTAGRTSSAPQKTDSCLLCVCALDTQVGNATAFQSTLISKYLSDPKAPSSGPPPAMRLCCGGEDCGSSACSASAQSTQSPELKSLLCYSCQLIVRDMSSADGLPQYILSEAQRRTRRSQLREEISEFLLDDNEGDSRD
ncbi:unnamed protein product [Ophioblennius macclurei]